MSAAPPPDPVSSALSGLPAVLLPYQQRLVEAVEQRRSVVVVEKSRRTGFSWVAAAIAALHATRSRAAAGMDVLYMGYEMEMTREFIGYVADWANAFSFAARPMEEFVWQDPDHPERSMLAYRVSFASGFEVVALPSKPRAFRGKQGLAILDEAAFNDDLDGALKAALAYLMWGGKVLVMSTHMGEDNPFNTLVQDIRAKKLNYTLLRCTFDEAMEQGLYRRICLRTGETWTEAGEQMFRAEILARYKDNADEELNCIPASGGGVPIPSSMARARISGDAPALSWKRDVAWAMQEEARRKAECDAWLEDNLWPALKRVPLDRPFAVGMDFALTRDLSVIWLAAIQRDTALRTALVVELRAIPYQQQKHILHSLLKRLPMKRGVALDAGGNGAVLAQETMQAFGAIVHQVTLSEPWYRENMPVLKRHFEDGTITLPRDEDIITDFAMLRLVRGVIRVPTRTAGADGGQRHGDAAIAAALMCFAAEQAPEVYDYRAATAAALAATADPGERRRQQDALEDLRGKGGRGYDAAGLRRMW